MQTLSLRHIHSPSRYRFLILSCPKRFPFRCDWLRRLSYIIACFQTLRMPRCNFQFFHVTFFSLFPLEFLSSFVITALWNSANMRPAQINGVGAIDPLVLATALAGTSSVTPACSRGLQVFCLLASALPLQCIETEGRRPSSSQENLPWKRLSN